MTDNYRFQKCFSLNTDSTFFDMAHWAVNNIAKRRRNYLVDEIVAVHFFSNLLKTPLNEGIVDYFFFKIVLLSDYQSHFSHYSRNAGGIQK